MYTFYGPIIGAALLTLLPELFRFASDFRMILYGVVVIVVVIVFPRGIVDDILYRIEVSKNLKRKQSSKSLKESNRNRGTD